MESTTNTFTIDIRRLRVLREQVKNVDFRGLYWQTISNAVMGTPWLKGKQFELVQTTTLPRVTKQMVKDQALLNIGADYYISQDCRVLVVSTGLGFFPPAKAGHPRAASIVAYHSAEVGRPDGEQAIALWSTNGAAAFRKAAFEAMLKAYPKTRFIGHADAFWANISADYANEAAYPAGKIKPGARGVSISMRISGGIGSSHGRPSSWRYDRAARVRIVSATRR